MQERHEVTALLRRIESGDDSAAEQLMDAVHSELRVIAGRLMSGERPDHTLQATALVNEAYLRIFGSKAPNWNDRAHFFRVSSLVMQHILIDYARQRIALRRGGGRKQDPFMADIEAKVGDLFQSEDLQAVKGSIERLEKTHSQWVEVLRYRLFLDMKYADIAAVMNLTEGQSRAIAHRAIAYVRDDVMHTPRNTSEESSG